MQNPSSHFWFIHRAISRSCRLAGSICRMFLLSSVLGTRLPTTWLLVFGTLAFLLFLLCWLGPASCSFCALPSAGMFSCSSCRGPVGSRVPLSSRLARRACSVGDGMGVVVRPCPSTQHRKVTGARSACAIFSASITGHFCAVLLCNFLMLRNGRYRNWVFTLNNPYYALTPDLDLVVNAPVSFMAWQLEVGAEGTEHYQGYLELASPCSLLQMHQLGGGMLLGAHFEVIYFAPFLICMSSALLMLILTSGSSHAPESGFCHGLLWRCTCSWNLCKFLLWSLQNHVVSPCLLSTLQYHPISFVSIASRWDSEASPRLCD